MVRVFKYAVIRLAVFFVVWGACMLLGLGWVFSTIAAAVIALAAGYLFFNDLRTGAGRDVASAWQGRGEASKDRDRFASERADADAEDAYTEGRYLDPGAGPGPGLGDGPGSERGPEKGPDAGPDAERGPWESRGR